VKEKEDKFEKMLRGMWWLTEEGINRWEEGVIRSALARGQDPPAWLPKAVHRLKRRLRKRQNSKAL